MKPNASRGSPEHSDQTHEKQRRPKSEHVQGLVVWENNAVTCLCLRLCDRTLANRNEEVRDGKGGQCLGMRGLGTQERPLPCRRKHSPASTWCVVAAVKAHLVTVTRCKHSHRPVGLESETVSSNTTEGYFRGAWRGNKSFLVLLCCTICDAFPPGTQTLSPSKPTPQNGLTSRRSRNKTEHGKALTLSCFV